MKRLEHILTVMIVFFCIYGALQYMGVELPEIPGIKGVTVAEEETEEPFTQELPRRYDLRDNAKQPAVRSQGGLGTCWAIAASSALESTLLPGEELVFAADHMSLRNSFERSQNDGGDYTMVMAYLTAWQGPVLEEDDPYGDEYSPDNLSPVKHVQEIQIFKGKNYQKIKEAIYRYGAVQTSIYMDLQSSNSVSEYYNKDTYAYSYPVAEAANHDIIIIGWDDDFPAENFCQGVTQDGAFICQNSWGTKFADDGVFYVSYEDAKIGENSVVYTKIEPTDNYDRLYQTDLCGWVGQLGYEKESCYFANVYTADSAQDLKAIGIYALGENTRYKVYVINDYESTIDLVLKKVCTEGKIENQGFYTIPLKDEISVEQGEKFAVIVEISTPGTNFPVAVEYKSDEEDDYIDLSDGEGYISSNGFVWTSSEDNYSSNICLKVYADEKQ